MRSAVEWIALTAAACARIRPKKRSPLSPIATDRISPHYGHDVVETNGEGGWRCLTCDPKEEE